MTRRLFFLLLCFIVVGCGSLHISVQVYDPRAGTLQPTLTALSCEGLFFFGTFPGVCPNSAVDTVNGAFQAYDGGYMVWENSLRNVYVLFNDGTGVMYTEAVITTFPDAPIQELPPPNHFKPIRGFSRVWTHEETVRQRLGWSYGLEQAYIVRVQTAEAMIFFDLPNGQVIQFEANGNWHVIR